MTWEDFTDSLPVKPRHALPVFAFASLLLFAPPDLLETLDLQEMSTRYRLWIGLGWTVSGALLLPYALLPIFLGAGVLLFAPADSLASLGLDKPEGQDLFWVGLAFFVSGSLVLSRMVAAFTEPWRDWVATMKKKQKRKLLAPEEKKRPWEPPAEDEAPRMRSMQKEDPEEEE